MALDWLLSGSREVWFSMVRRALSFAGCDFHRTFFFIALTSSGLIASTCTSGGPGETVAMTSYQPGIDDGPVGSEGNGDDDDDDDDASGSVFLDLGVVKLDTPSIIEDPDADDMTTCSDVQAMVDPTIPTVFLVLDQSFSMVEPFGAGTRRWDAVYDTLFDPTEGVVRLLDSRVSFGMTLYTGIREGGFLGSMEPAECPALTTQEPVLGDPDVLDAIYASAEPIGDTPTGDSLDALIPVFAATVSDGPKVIVLATDGEPDTCAVPDPDLGQPEALAAAERSFAAGLPLFIISVGDDVGADHLQDMANVGVGKELDDPSPAPYYQALNPAELVDAFLEIVGSLVSCEFAVNGEVDLERACEGEVTVNGAPITCGTDWEVTSPSLLTLVGESCEMLKRGEPIELAATWPCDVIIPAG